MVLAACNRALHPRSKRGWASWAEGTSLAHLHPGLKTKTLTSQFFWDMMHRISLDALARIERDLTKLVVADLGISLDTLFYDTTNFFTYIDSTNAHCDLPQRGHSKQKRSDLRLFGLALLVSRDGQIPLCTQIYPGNRVDATEFPPALTLIRSRLADLSLTLQDVTLVYDRGNLSQKNQHMIDEATVGYVSALVPAQHRDLMAIPLSDYQHIQTGRLKGLRVHRTTKTVWGPNAPWCSISVRCCGQDSAVGWIRGWRALEGPPCLEGAPGKERDPDRAHPVPPNGASTASSPPSSSSRSCPSPMMAARPELSA